MHPLVKHSQKDDYEVYIGRPSYWGNPFQIGVDGTREEVVAMYATRLVMSPSMTRTAQHLKGQTLGCYCSPHLCHGDILAQVANPDLTLPMLEKDVERPVAAYARKRDVISIKLAGLDNRGKPDHLFFFQGRILVIEFKATGKKMTPKQLNWQVRFRTQKFHHHMVDSRGRGFECIDALINDEMELL